jgi:hypothetical protein
MHSLHNAEGQLRGFGEPPGRFPAPRLRAAKTDCKAAATQINLATIMGIELFEIT